MLRYALNSDWSVVNLKTFEECAHIQLDNKNEPLAESISIEDFVDIDSTLHLVPRDTANPAACELEILSADHILFKSINIVSNCGIMEVSSQSQYLRTEKGDLVDDFEGISSYKCTIILPKASKQVCLKFMKNFDLWIFGLQIVLQKCASSSSTTQINPDNVNQMLSGVNLSANALNCKQLLEANRPPSLDSVMAMISKNDFYKIPKPIPEQSNIEILLDQRLRLFEQRVMEKIGQPFQ